MDEHTATGGSPIEAARTGASPNDRLFSRRKALATGAAAISALGIGAHLTSAAPASTDDVEPTTARVITGSGVILRRQSQVWINEPEIIDGSSVLITLLGDTGAYVGPMLSVSIIPGQGFNVDLGVNAGRTTTFNYLVILPAEPLSAGVPGPTGANGPNGMTGPTGPTGPTGIIGPTGSGAGGNGGLIFGNGGAGGDGGTGGIGGTGGDGGAGGTGGAGGAGGDGGLFGDGGAGGAGGTGGAGGFTGTGGDGGAGGIGGTGTFG